MCASVLYLLSSTWKCLWVLDHWIWKIKRLFRYLSIFTPYIWNELSEIEQMHPQIVCESSPSQSGQDLRSSKVTAYWLWTEWTCDILQWYHSYKQIVWYLQTDRCAFYRSSQHLRIGCTMVMSSANWMITTWPSVFNRAQDGPLGYDL